MKGFHGLPLNITFAESVLRFGLLIPAGIIAVAGIVALHTFVFLIVPPYLLFTSLTSYGPLKHLYRKIRHIPVFTDYNDPILSSDLL
jgi:hypothetical protein